jgi:phage-related protein
LRNVAENGGDALADFFKTPAGQLKLFDKAIKDFQVTVGQQLLPVFTPIVEALSTLLQLFGQLPGPVKATAVAVTALGAAFAILGGPITAIVAGIIGITLVIKKLADENEAFANALQGAWNNILAGLAGVGAFFQAFFANIQQQGAAFIQYWQGLGSLLAETWNQGIANITEAFGRWQGYFNQVVQAIANAWNQLMGLIPDAFFKAVSALGQIFSPFVDFLNSAFGAISNAWNSLLESMGLNWGTLINEMIAAVLPLTRVFKAMGIDIGEAISSGVQSGFQAFSSFQPGEVPSLNLPGVSGLTTVTPPGGGGGGGGGGKGGGGASEAQKQLEQQQQQLKAAQDLLFASENQLKALEGITEAEKLSNASKIEKLEIERKYAELLESSLSNEEQNILKQAQQNELKANEIELEQALKGLRDGALASINEQIAEQQAIIAGKEEEYQIQKQINELVAAGGGEISREEAAGKVNQLAQLKEQAEATKELESQFSSLASGIAGEFTSAFKSIIDGSKDVNEAFADMLQGIADQFLNMAMKILQDAITQQLMSLFTSLAGGIGGGGGGGFGVTPLTSGMSFFEGGGYTGDAPRSGGVDGKGGFPAILHPQETVVDHYGDSAAAMTNAAKAFSESGEAIAMATATRSANNQSAAEASAMQTAEEYFQSGKSTVSFDTYRVGEMDVVTREDAMKIGMQSAKQAEANVYKGLRNMPAVRGRSGVK